MELNNIKTKHGTNVIVAAIDSEFVQLDNIGIVNQPRLNTVNTSSRHQARGESSMVDMPPHQTGDVYISRSTCSALRIPFIICSVGMLLLGITAVVLVVYFTRSIPQNTGHSTDTSSTVKPTITPSTSSTTKPTTSTVKPTTITPTGIPQFGHLTSYNMPYEVKSITDTRDGDLVMVETYGKRVGIFTHQGQLKTNITIPGAFSLQGVTRWGDHLFITDYDDIHVLNDDGSFIQTIKTSITFMHGIAVQNNTIWVTTFEYGAYKLTVDNQYNVIDSVMFAPHSSSFNHSNGIAVWESHVIIVCTFSDNVHIFDHSGRYIVPPIRVEATEEQIWFIDDVTTDKTGNIYVSDYIHNRVVLFSKTGQHIGNVVTKENGLIDSPQALHLQNNYLYVGAAKFQTEMYTLYVIKLTGL